MSPFSDHSCADIWNIKTGNQIFFLGISFIFHVSVKHWPRFASTNIFVLFTKLKLTRIAHFYCSGVFSHPSIQYSRWVNFGHADDSHMYQEAYLRRHGMICCNLSSMGGCCCNFGYFICIWAISQTGKSLTWILDGGVLWHHIANTQRAKS